jgi:hypothetical protein
MLDLVPYGSGWLLLDVEVSKEGIVTPMDWCEVERGFSYQRKALVGNQREELQRWLDQYPEACLYRVLAHTPITTVQPIPDKVFEAQLVMDDTGIYVDDYGLRVFCATRLSPTYKEDMDLRNDNYDYLREIIEGVNIFPALDAAELRHRFRYRDQCHQSPAR